jgi:transcriptional regulator with XRE-family HTH domain
VEYRRRSAIKAQNPAPRGQSGRIYQVCAWWLTSVRNTLNLDIALEVRPHPYFVQRQRGHNSFKVRAKSVVGFQDCISGNEGTGNPEGSTRFLRLTVDFEPGKGWLMAGIGARLRAIRQEWQLSLREVEQRSLSIARERGDLSYQVSASWLARLESDQHELTVNKLIALAQIYSIPTDQLLRSIDPENAQSLILDPLSSLNETPLLTEGSLDSQATRLRLDSPVPDQSPDETALLLARHRPSGPPYRRAIIGKLDLTLDPMIPAGSIVQIDTRKREISPKKDWTHEFQRPIYFLRTKDGHVCGWCELDRNSEWLTLIPHPLSPASSRRWRYPTEVENLGRVMSVVIRLGQ